MQSHTSSWRTLLALAPVVLAGFVVVAVLQGEHDMLRSAGIFEALLPLALLGAWSAWRIAKAWTETPATPVAQARPGRVVLGGNAQPLPGHPLVSPDGTPCVWFHHMEGGQSSKHIGSPFRAGDSALPFLLTDASGSCIVIPEGADIGGGQTRRSGFGRERLILAGDPLQVTGELRAPSPAGARQLEEALRRAAAHAVAPSTVIAFGPGEDLHALRVRAVAEQALPPASAPATTGDDIPLRSLALVAAPADGSPYRIRSGAAGDDGGFYRLATWLNLLLALAAAAMLARALALGAP